MSGHDVRSQGRGRMPDSMVPSIPNLSSYSSGCDLGNSFSALLSGPTLFSPCDFRELPNPKQFSASSRVPTEDTGSLFSAFGSRVPLISRRGQGDLPSQGFDNEKVKDSSSPRGEWRSTNPRKCSVKLPDTNCQMPGKLASQAELSVSKNSSALSHQYPHVF
ncbi:hypothetical protein OIU76_019889 [Salix suchowensis]|nr:hypothetical protein OIU76_019889 [Salix suchowensis]